jgi:hypothetical protein
MIKTLEVRIPFAEITVLEAKVVMATLPADSTGLYAFEIDEDGHLILTYADGTPPDFTIDGDGHLIYTF